MWHKCLSLLPKDDTKSILACDQCGWTLWNGVTEVQPCWRCEGTIRPFSICAYKAWFNSKYVDTMKLGEFVKKLGL